MAARGAGGDSRLAAAVLRAGGRTLLTLLACAVAMITLLGADRSEPTATSRALPDQVQLSSDAGTTALFDARGLGGGQKVTNCVKVQHGNARLGATVRLYGNAVRSELSPYLAMTVEVGRDGDAGDCSRFQGRQVFAGTLATFLAAHGGLDTGLPVLTLAARSGTSSFRFTFQVQDVAAAQGLTTEAAFVWRAPSRKIVDEPAVAAGGGSGGSDGGDAAGKKRSGVAAALQDLLRDIRQVAGPVIRGAVFPLLLAAPVMLFLALQDRFDRRDPKLALAPVHAEPTLAFGALGGA